MVQFEKNQPGMKKALQSTLFGHYLQGSVSKFHPAALASGLCPGPEMKGRGEGPKEVRSSQGLALYELRIRPTEVY